MHVQQAFGVRVTKLCQHGLGSRSFLSLERLFETPVEVTSFGKLSYREGGRDFRGVNASQEEQHVDFGGVLLKQPPVKCKQSRRLIAVKKCRHGSGTGAIATGDTNNRGLLQLVQPLKRGAAQRLWRGVIQIIKYVRITHGDNVHS